MIDIVIISIVWWVIACALFLLGHVWGYNKGRNKFNSGHCRTCKYLSTYKKDKSYYNLYEALRLRIVVDSISILGSASTDPVKNLNNLIERIK